MWGVLRIAVAFIVAFTITASVAAQDAKRADAVDDTTARQTPEAFSGATELRYDPANPPRRVKLLEQYPEQPDQITIRWI